jgi:small subunit ribosomal protein S5
MSDEKKATTNTPNTPATAAKAAKTVAKDIYGSDDRKKGSQGGRSSRRGNDRNRDDKSRDEFEQRILDIARVTRVMAGGKRMNFRACVALGDKKGKIGIGLGKGADVTMAVNKAVNQAKKVMITVQTHNETITHEIYERLGAAKLLFKPARKGRGVIAGGVSRVILELAGIKNVTAKQLGTNNKINNARCALLALSHLRKSEKTSKTEAKDAKDAKEVKDAAAVAEVKKDNKAKAAK